MILTLIRDHFTPAETLGKLYIDRKPFCDTLEPPAVPNARHPKGCIPVGWYKVRVTRSPKFGRQLPLLYHVPVYGGPAANCGGESGSPEHFNDAERQSVCEGAERVGIRIHAGNNRDHTSGCILVGELYSRPSYEGYSVPTLCRSKATEQALTNLLIQVQTNHEEIYIDITDSDRYPLDRPALAGL